MPQPRWRSNQLSRRKPSKRERCNHAAATWNEGCLNPTCKNYYDKGGGKGWSLNPDLDEINALEGHTMIPMPNVVTKKKGATTQHQYSGQGSFYGGGQVAHYPSCTHKGDKVVFEWGAKKLYAARGFDLDEFSDEWGLIIDLANNVRPPLYSRKFLQSMTSERLKVLEKHTVTIPPKVVTAEVLQLDWPDMGIPPVWLDFWRDLWKLMPERTVIACVGGHGRTGTALAALIIAAGYDYWSALETVRKEHCEKAVESLVQEKYLHALYVEYLEEALEVATAAGNANEVADLQADIDHAAKQVPSYTNNTSSKQSSKGTTKQLGPANPATTPGDIYTADGEVMKMIGGEVHYLVCTEPTCTDRNCVVPSHEGWVSEKSLGGI